MRRSMRIILNGLTVLSLVLAIGVSIRWLNWVIDGVRIRRTFGPAAHLHDSFAFYGVSEYGVRLVVFAFLPCAWLWLFWSRSRRREANATHACAACGYDLRATPERCPECGTVPEATARSSPA